MVANEENKHEVFMNNFRKCNLQDFQRLGITNGSFVHARFCPDLENITDKWFLSKYDHYKEFSRNFFDVNIVACNDDNRYKGNACYSNDKITELLKYIRF